MLHTAQRGGVADRCRADEQDGLGYRLFSVEPRANHPRISILSRHDFVVHEILNNTRNIWKFLILNIKID